MQDVVKTSFVQLHKISKWVALISLIVVVYANYNSVWLNSKLIKKQFLKLGKPFEDPIGWRDGHTHTTHTYDDGVFLGWNNDKVFLTNNWGESWI